MPDALLGVFLRLSATCLQRRSPHIQGNSQWAHHRIPAPTEIVLVSSTGTRKDLKTITKIILSFSLWLSQPSRTCSATGSVFNRKNAVSRSGLTCPFWMFRRNLWNLEERMHKKLTHHHVCVSCIQSPEPPESGFLAGHAHGELFHKFSIFLDASFLLVLRSPSCCGSCCRFS